MAFLCTPEEHKLICEMAARSGMNRQDYIIAKLTDTQVEAKPSVSLQKGPKDSMAELAKEVHLAASYGELSESLQWRIELVMRFSGRSESRLMRQRKRRRHEPLLWKSRLHPLWMPAPTP